MIKESISGVLLVNKPSGPTSYDMIRWIKRSHRKTKIGHAGTLDPLASGLLIVLLGQATKQQDSFMKMEKTYRFSMRLGVQTDSGDRTGHVIKEMPVPTLEDERIHSVLKSFLGEQSQIPPMYSALKKEGVPLYKLARKGEVVERQPRPITLHALSHLGRNGLGDMEIRVRCSSGTYVRTLAEDLGAAFGSCGMMTDLVREGIGPYFLSQALEGEKLKTMSSANIAEFLLQLENV